MPQSWSSTDSTRLTPACSSPPSAAPVRCGAFADERRIVVATKSAGCGREMIAQSPRAVRLWVENRCWVLGLAYALPSVAWPPMRQGSRRSIRFARLEREPITRS